MVLWVVTHYVYCGGQGKAMYDSASLNDNDMAISLARF
jgi:hypothetical protein